MSEFQDIGDLRPAPRATPLPVLWAMLAVVLSCIGLLVWASPVTPGDEPAVISAADGQNGVAEVASPQRAATTDAAPAWSPTR